MGYRWTLLMTKLPLANQLNIFQYLHKSALPVSEKLAKPLCLSPRESPSVVSGGWWTAFFWWLVANQQAKTANIPQVDRPHDTAEQLSAIMQAVAARSKED